MWIFILGYLLWSPHASANEYITSLHKAGFDDGNLAAYCSKLDDHTEFPFSQQPHGLDDICVVVDIVEIWLFSI
ncbi:Hypothetical predicted protein [Octopus vulgaris]|uniref:Uncharacterized protein n=1 Tax=Octopus vulgaris TaxID=6645 RepID=A0AA36EXD4_OCTVU|nr:Hypothetical predicted protein [Octopus vulgaris]